MGANRLYIPSLKINAPMYTSTVSNGALTIPKSSAVGRWSGSSWWSNTNGRAVIAGHIDSPQRAYAGALAAIRNAKPGQVVWISDSKRKVYRFVVRNRYNVNKNNLPYDVFYGSGPMKVSLVTCGGSTYYSAAARARIHRDNTVVTLTR